MQPGLEPVHGRAGAGARVAHRAEAGRGGVPPHHQRHRGGEDLPPTGQGQRVLGLLLLVKGKCINKEPCLESPGRLELKSSLEVVSCQPAVHQPRPSLSCVPLRATLCPGVQALPDRQDPARPTPEALLQGPRPARPVHAGRRVPGCVAQPSIAQRSIAWAGGVVQLNWAWMAAVCCCAGQLMQAPAPL